MPTFKNMKKSKMKISYKMSNEMISLPLYPELTKKKQYKVISEIKNFFSDLNGRCNFIINNL